jgi:beta-glucuronidase
MRAAGANFVRLCHYPHHPGELDLCDELGLLAMCEIPLYWWRGLEEGPEACEQTLAAARRQLTTLIRRDANHSSVAFWSVSNETHEQHAEVAAGNAELIRLARELDPTRLAVHVSDHWRDHPRFDEDDVICVNHYPTWRGRLTAGDASYDPAESTRQWREALRRLHEAHPHKPILVTELGYPCLEGVFAGPLGEDVQAAAIEAELAGMDGPYVCGTTIWCYADHPWPERDFLKRLTTSPFGVVSRRRRKLAAFETVRRLFRQKQRS